MVSSNKKAPDRAEVQRLLTQLRRMEARSGRRAASMTVAVPPGVDPGLVAAALRQHVDTEVVAHRVADSVVCRVTTVEFELLDEIIEAASATRGILP